ARALAEIAEGGGLTTYSSHFVGSRKALVDRVAQQASLPASTRKKIAGLVEGYNRTFDLISSVALYMSLKDANVSNADAAGHTLDTMNFRQSRPAMTIFIALYAFALPAAIR